MPSPPHLVHDAGGPEAAGDRRPLRVLCVDDNPLVIQTVKHLIENAPGLQWVDGLTSAAELVQRCRSDNPDVVLLDIAMTGPEAFEAMRSLQASASGSRVIIHTAQAAPANIDKAYDVGAWGFVSKFDPSEHLLNVIRAVGAGIMLAPRKR